MRQLACGPVVRRGGKGSSKGPCGLDFWNMPRPIFPICILLFHPFAYARWARVECQHGWTEHNGSPTPMPMSVSFHLSTNEDQSESSLFFFVRMNLRIVIIAFCGREQATRVYRGGVDEKEKKKNKQKLKKRATFWSWHLGDNENKENKSKQYSMYPDTYWCFPRRLLRMSWLLISFGPTFAALLGASKLSPRKVKREKKREQLLRQTLLSTT